MELYNRWIDRLGELCNFRENNPEGGDWTWNCSGKGDQRFTLAKQAATDVGGEFTNLLLRARERGGAYCDCEILLNCTDDA